MSFDIPSTFLSNVTDDSFSASLDRAIEIGAMSKTNRIYLLYVISGY